MRPAKSTIFFWGLLFVLLGMARDLVAQEKNEKQEKNKDGKKEFIETSVGELTFQYANELVIKERDRKRSDIVFLTYKDPPPALTMICVVPVRSSNISDLVNQEAFFEGLKVGIASVLGRDIKEPIKWKTLKSTIPISKYEVASKLVYGRIDKKSFSLDFRLIKYEQTNFVVGLIQEQCFGKEEVEKRFDEGNLCRDNFYQLIYLAQIAASVTGETIPKIWPPLGRSTVQGVPAKPIK